jgi:hypothetical protein
MPVLARRAIAGSHAQRTLVRWRQMSERPGYPGENPAHQMRKLPRANPQVACGSCRQFDGAGWCRRWNFHTAPDGLICAFYRPASRPSS